MIAQTDGLADLLSDSAADTTAFTLDKTGDADKVLSMGADGSDTLSVPADPSDLITMTREDGSSLGVELPGSPENGKAVGENMVLFEDVDKDTDALIQPQRDGGVRVLTVIKSSQSPTEFDYDLKLDTDHELFRMQDGRVAIVDDDETVFPVLADPVFTWVTSQARRTSTVRRRSLLRSSACLRCSSGSSSRTRSHWRRPTPLMRRQSGPHWQCRSQASA